MNLTDEWIRDTCLALPGTEAFLKEEWGSLLYRVGGKYFAMRGTDKEGRQILTLKCDPRLAEEYRECYKQIVPGYYSNKSHWNSLLLEEGGTRARFCRRHDPSLVRIGARRTDQKDSGRTAVNSGSLLKSERFHKKPTCSIERFVSSDTSVISSDSACA